MNIRKFMALIVSLWSVSMVSADVVDVPKIEMGVGLFEDCLNLTSINITTTIEDITSLTFDNCSNLKSITLPVNLRSISADALRECRGLETVVCHAMVPPAVIYSASEFDSFAQSYVSGATLRVPQGCKRAYAAAPGWENFLTIVDDLEASGVDGIAPDPEGGPAEYFTLQGIRIENPQNGLYIRRQNGKTTKVLIR